MVNEIEIKNQKCKTLACRSRLNTYIAVHEIARKAGISPSDWLNQVIEREVAKSKGVNTVNENVFKTAPVNAVNTANNSSDAAYYSAKKRREKHEAELAEIDKHKKTVNEILNL
jgi:uncharacterized protein (DUF2342 family)